MKKNLNITKNVLITGAGGFIGSHVLIHFLHNTDWQLILVDSFRHKGKTDRITQQITVSHPEYWERIKVITHDLRAPFSQQMINEIGKIDYVVNLASESHVDRSISDPRDFVENNISLMLTMLEWAKDIKPEKFIQVSTDEVYGPAPEESYFVEWDTHRPSNPYSASKAAQEDIAYSYWRTYNVPLIITNSMNVIGELQDKEKFVPMTMKKLLTGESVPIHADEYNVPGARFYLHARNQADAMLFILTNIMPVFHPDGWQNPPKFHIVGDKEIDNLSMAKLIAEYMATELKYHFVTHHRPGHDLRYALDGGKLYDVGWKPPVSLEDSLKSTVEWTLLHPEWLL